MVGENKVKFIKEELKIDTFEYFGNSKKDLPIWNHCKKIIYTNASVSLKRIIENSKLDKYQVKANFKIINDSNIIYTDSICVPFGCNVSWTKYGSSG